MTHLILIRHGETDWNLARRIQGSTDIPLNDTGRAQARRTAETLVDDVDAGSTRIASSDLSRAAETADIIAATLGLGEVRRYPQLRERGYGQAEGLDIEQFHERWPAGTTVPEAEPPAAVRARALAGLDQAVRDAGPADTLLVVAHGALIREVLGYATDEALPAAGERLANGSAQHFAWDGGVLRLRAYAPA